MSAYVGTTISAGFGLGSAQPFSGTGTFIIDVAIDEVVTIQDPVNFTAVYSSGSPASGSLTVTYDYRCIGDATGDGEVNIQDLLEVISDWGVVGLCLPDPPCPSDVAPPLGNSRVDIADVLAVIARWGTCPTPK